MTEPRPLLDLFVPGKVRRQDNGSQGSWRKKAGYRKRWRERVQAFVLSSSYRCANVKADAPKTVRLRAAVFNLFDDDGLAAALKPVVDGLVSAGVIHSDKPESVSGHRILRAQYINRKAEGVSILVTLGVELAVAPLTMEAYEAFKGSD